MNRPVMYFFQPDTIRLYSSGNSFIVSACSSKVCRLTARFFMQPLLRQRLPEEVPYFLLWHIGLPCRQKVRTVLLHIQIHRAGLPPRAVHRVPWSKHISRYNEMNVLSMHALIGAYSSTGAEWLEELLQVLEGNMKYACSYVKDHFEGISTFKAEGTYMLYLDCTEWCKAHGKTIDDVLKDGFRVGLAWQDGRHYGSPCHIRLNLALPLSRVQEAFRRMDTYVFNTTN